jgi:hypothetical protein
MSDSSSDGRQASTKKRTKAGVERKDAGASSEGVLANLPRTRPQRSSARRDAARRAAPETKAKPKTKPTPSTVAKPPLTAAKASSAPTRKANSAPTRKATTPKQRPAATRATAKALQDPAPRQGFETERDPISGSVQPPGGVDLFTSAAELAGELTKSGISAGGRLLKDVFARLPLN